MKKRKTNKDPQTPKRKREQTKPDRGGRNSEEGKNKRDNHIGAIFSQPTFKACDIRPPGLKVEEVEEGNNGLPRRT